MPYIFDNLAVSLVLCTFVIGGMIFYQGKHNKRKTEEANEKFWAKEQKANSTRKKDISDLVFIEIPFDTLPFVDTDNYDINQCQKELLELKDKKIVNLSSYSNTDLKLKYGVPNFTTLCSYDENYSNLIKTLTNLGCHLSKNGYHSQAIYFLELALENGCDISRAFYALADEYIRDNQKSEIEKLIKKATALNSAMAPSIVNTLKSKLK